MSANQRPLAVTIVAGLYIAVGVAGFIAHSPELKSKDLFLYDGLEVELVELVAIVCGAFMLRASNWARWVALAWIAFHVILSAFHAWGELAMHSLFFILIAWFLFRPDAARYFRRAPVAQQSS